ncbi:MAG: Trk system potassium transporter TrkA [Alloprevotella sp.]|nr:Trk system potassium transporter TrkA [Alloprevotella sp.]
MKIIIAGAGAVGTHLAKLFSRENHDITLIDEDASRLEHLGVNYDILTLCASPRLISTLQEAEAARADLVISVTPDEAHNITICMLASKLGAKKTVARVDNYEYALPRNREYFKSAGISSIVYPEMLAGEEIMQGLRRGWVRQWIEIQNGALLLLCVKLASNAQILHKPLREVCPADAPFHITAIKRRGETLIPHGDDVLENRDAVYFMTTPEYVNTIRILTGKEDFPEVRNVVFLGGGSTTERALSKMPDTMHAKVFETDIRRIEHLDEVLNNKNVMYINGDGTDLDLLIDEGLRNAQAFVATSRNSQTNILACLTAKRNGVKKTVVMVDNTDFVQMAESLDIGSVLNKKQLAAGHIYQMLLKADVTTVKCLTIAAADVAELVVKEGSRVARRPVRELRLPQSVTLGGLVRDGRGYLINGNTLLEPGDTVVAFCMEGSLKQIERLFK